MAARKGTSKGSRVRTSPPVAGPKVESMSVRKISNGYVTSHSKYTRGKYVEREVFSATRPKFPAGDK